LQQIIDQKKIEWESGGVVGTHSIWVKVSLDPEKLLIQSDRVRSVAS
jgi:hypothetical protein